MRSPSSRLDHTSRSFPFPAGANRPKNSKPVLLLLLITFLLAPLETLWAQEQPKISVQVKVVNVLATVRDKHGKIIPDLTKDDFVLEEDTHRQTITYFSHETDLP